MVSSTQNRLGLVEMEDLFQVAMGLFIFFDLVPANLDLPADSAHSLKSL